MMEVTLFHFESEDIKIDIIARFEGEALVIDGFDMGKRVAEYWGGSDYEYNMKIGAAGVEILCTNFGVPQGEKQQLLDFLAAQYNTNTCYSQLEDLFTALGIQRESLKWSS
jgi:hypothetical protein